MAQYAGFSLHAGIGVEADRRAKLERLARYVSRPPVSVERLSLTTQGQVRYRLKTPYRDGTTDIVLGPVDFIARLAALVPPPRVHLTRYQGVFAADAPLLFVYLFYNIEPMKKHRFGSLELTVLNAVARLGEEAYGLGVRRDVSELLGHDYSVGAIYTTLARLEEQGLLKSSTTAPLPVRGGRSRRQFRLSPAGRQALREGERLAVRMLDLHKAKPA